jgi:peptide/nickel transport system substrate-binding protein
MKKLSVFCAAACLGMMLSMNAAAAGKTDLVVAMDADIETLHPSDYSTTIEINILNQIYDKLIYMNPDGAEDPEPRIAQSWEISEDGLDYTFHLRDDVRFHDGTPLTAEDVKFSLEMYQNSDYQSANVDGLDTVEAVDDSTVVCHLASPYSPFLLGISACNIASKAYSESVSPEEFASNPNGCGPYRYVSRASGSNVVLEANEDYYGGAPEIKKVTFEVIPDTTTTAIALQTGEVNFAEIASSNLVMLESNPQITIAEAPTSGFTYVSMNLEKEPFSNVLVRQAINYAINRENLVAVCYDGKAEVNSNICAKSRFGYSDDQPQYGYDPEKAKELLAEAGIETPYDLGAILVAEKYENLATVIQADLAAVGLNTTIVKEEFNTYIGDLTSGSYDLCALEMTLEGDTQQLALAFTTDWIGMANNARYSDEEMDELFAQAGIVNDSEERAAIYDKIFTKAQEEAVYAVICNPQTLYAYSADLTVPEFVLEGYYYINQFTWNS